MIRAGMDHSVSCCIVTQPSPNHQMCVIPLLITGWRIFLNIHKGENKQGISCWSSPRGLRAAPVAIYSSKTPKNEAPVIMWIWHIGLCSGRGCTHDLTGTAWNKQPHTALHVVFLDRRVSSCWWRGGGQIGAHLLLDVSIYVQPGNRCVSYYSHNTLFWKRLRVCSHARPDLTHCQTILKPIFLIGPTQLNQTYEVLFQQTPVSWLKGVRLTLHFGK